ncbi:TPA: DUF3158 family protein [Salmonella enterica]|uniref:DUF3158 family protein n=1 Tax=Salmonella enterica TaxID=28901 RepID=UPI000F97C318|nr:DUF3158 family protein [Salmonella enterica subsp. enterica serovar Emek]EAN0050297.1 DUF3158 family protein [Salmonella enterica]HAC6524201.1 DUF3158 family protein [Salmonella enterica subsp. enterica serovar Enteritidis]EAS2641689.1 hypothetical protein [Salmonella enterica]EAV4979818.1 DUF3158 family protein [Salmonella enterica]
MMNNPVTGYQSLTDEDYKMLAYVSSLKGLLKPFKSKGELLESNARSVREMMEPLMQRLIQSARRYPVRQLPLIFTIGPAPSSANFLRWRNQQNNKSGTPAFSNLIGDPRIPQRARDALLEIERDRIVFNMQMSILTFIIRQARECQEKMEQAEKLYQGQQNS